MFTVKQKELDTALRIAVKCSASKSSLPALQCCKIEALEDGILISSTDLEAGVTVCVPALSGDSQKGAVLINAAQLASMVSTARKEEEVSIGIEGNTLRIGNARIKSAYPVEDYPTLPVMPKEAVTWPLDDNFSLAVQFAASARSKEKIRYAMTEVYFDFPRGRLVGTDGKRMHVAALGRPVKIEPLLLPPRIFSVIEPETIVIPIPKGKKKDSNYVAVAFVTFPNGIAFTRIGEGTFPDYTAVIPEEYPTQVEVEREPLLSGLKGLFPLFSDEAPRCRVIANGTMDLVVSDRANGVESSASVPSNINGPEADVVVNPYYFYECLAGLQCTLVHICFQKPNQAILIEDPETRWFGLVMPLTIDESKKASPPVAQDKTANPQES